MAGPMQNTLLFQLKCLYISPNVFLGKKQPVFPKYVPDTPVAFYYTFLILIWFDETWITATQALYLVGEFTAGKSVLWHAGASSVSISGIQLAKVGGASEIYATCGSDEKVAFC